MKAALSILALFFVTATLLPLIRHEVWWIRIFDFPRAQIAVAGAIVTMAYLYFWDTRSVVEGLILGALVLCVGYQGLRMIPYTGLVRQQVKSAETPRAPMSLSVAVVNVLMTNREAERLLGLLREYDPDIILTVETDEWWKDALSELDEDYPYTVKKPLPNTYGMILHSRKPLLEPQVKYLIADSIPSIHAGVRLDSGVEVTIHCLHPRPPYPREDTDTRERDAELLVVGREAKESDAPTIVMGDMNDVAWSYTTTLFQKVSGLLDPRIGRGLFNTYHAGNPLLRWPLDHIFISEHFELVDIQRMPAWGSDHFPMFVHLHFSESAEDENRKPEADEEDREEAAEKIQEGAAAD